MNQSIVYRIFGGNMRKIFVLFMMISLCGGIFFAQETAEEAVHTEAVPAEETVAEVAASESGAADAIKYLAAGLAVGLACIAGGMAVARIGAAAMGAMAENAELSGKALPFVGLAEGICLWGFLVALFIILN